MCILFSFKKLLEFPRILRAIFEKVDLVLKMHRAVEVTRSNNVPHAGELAKLIRVDRFPDGIYLGV